LNGNQAATGICSGNGSGITNGKVSNQPYTDGTTIGSGNGSGTSVVGGSTSANYALYLGPEGINGDAAFKSTGGGSGFVDGSLGSVGGTASAGASGTAQEIIGPGFKNPTVGDLVFSERSAANGNGAFVGGYSPSLEDGASAANGNGAFVGGYSPSREDGSAGASGSSSGSLDVAGSGSANPYQVARVCMEMFLVAVRLRPLAGGSGTGSNMFGSWWGLAREPRQAVPVVDSHNCFRSSTQWYRHIYWQFRIHGSG
jgi:hypothetical protein